jgi:DNA-binding transcriptional LysR family regulator
VDLATGGFDAGIRLGQFIAPDMVVVPLSSPFPFVVVGSPEYLSSRKRPVRIGDLQGHACLRIRRSNGAIALAQVPGPIAREAVADGRLRALLTRFAVMTPGVFLYHPGRRQVLPKLRAFIEHVKAVV